MTIAIEASSLSQVTAIAARPPLRLDEFRQKHTEPLTLYIARVPGRRDVFLTPVKPRQRVVTAEDVQSSLYYVHVNTDEDADIISTAAQDYHTLNGLPQHPPAIAAEHFFDGRHDSRQDPYTLSKAQQHQQTPARKPLLPRRKPVLSDITNSSAQASAAFSNVTLLPPRPLPSLPADDDSPSGPDHTTGHLFSPANFSQHEASLRGLPMTPSEVDHHETLHGSLTVIRRDPATADQWNVAAVRDLLSSETRSTTSSKRSSWLKPDRKTQCALDLEVTNPAYAAFIPTDSTQTDARSQSLDSSELNATFTRQLHSLHGVANRSSIAATASRTSMSSDEQVWTRRSRFSANADMDPSTSQQSRRRPHYSFASPWNGQCMFLESSSGTALKCIHQPPDAQQALDVSELRFNLPSQARSTDNTTHSKRFSRLGDLHRRLHSHDQVQPTPDSPLNENDFDDSASLDLSLGQERAGGGFGGRQAKLGKLIIHPDGLPMLDLLVAANIGLWWRAWERTT